VVQDYVEYVTGRLPYLRRLAFALVGDPHRADDVVQETVTKLYVHWRRAQGATNLDAYVRAMVVRVFLDEKRHRWARVELLPAAPDRSAGPAPDPIEALTVRTALAQLPPRQRAVLVLRFVEDLPVDEVAQLLGCSPGTVKSQTFHGLASMRRLINEDNPAERARS
jgi:RNA polymerase sigma-70 factor (sigma-E family)